MDIAAYPRRYENPRTVSGKIIWLIEKSTHNLKHFILRNKFFIDIIFIIIYLTEQAIFLYFLYIEKFNFRTTASLFVLVLLSTMAIEKVLMELRYTALNRNIAIYREEREEMEDKVNRSLNLVEKLFYLRKKSKKG